MKFLSNIKVEEVVKSSFKQIKFLEITFTLSLITIIATVLFPRGLVLFEKAQVSSVEYTFSSFRAAVQAVHNKWLAESSSFIRIHNNEIAQSGVLVNSKGWPVAVVDEDKKNKHLYSTPDLQCEKLWEFLLTSQTNSDKATTLKESVRTKQINAQCEYYFSVSDEQYSILYNPAIGLVRINEN